MSRCQVVPCQPAHLSAIASRLRAEERMELDGARETARHLLYRLWRNSEYRMTAFVDGEIAAVWGRGGMLLSPVGEVWLFTTPVVERVPMTFVREGRKALAEMLKTKAKLVSNCTSGCHRSIRFWTMLGFKCLEAQGVPSGAMFHTLVMER